MIDQPELGKRMEADRKAKGMSRQKYADAIGLTVAKVANIEKGSKVKSADAEKLGHLAFVSVDAADPSADATTPAAGGEGNPAPGAPAAGMFEREQAQMLLEYRKTYERLQGHGPSAIAYLPQWGNPSECTNAGTQQSIRRWCVEVNDWLTAQGVPPHPEDVTPPEDAPDATIIPFPTGTNDPPPDPIDDDEDEELGLAIVTEAPWPEDDGVKRWTNGEMRTFKRCHRKWWLAYYRKLGLATHKVTGAAPTGTRFHRCLAVFYVPEGVERKDPFEELERTYQEDLVKVAGDEYAKADLEKEVKLVRTMLEGYFEWLAETGADQGLTVIAPEARIEADARIEEFPSRIMAKVDIRVERTLGTDTARLFVDHKTVGDLTTPTKMLHMDEQMLHYHLVEFFSLLDAGIDAEEMRVDGALYNMARKVLRTATAKPPFYDRVEVRHNEHTLHSYYLRLKGQVMDILELTRKLDEGADPRQVAYPNPTKDCSWDCEFFHVCPMFDDGSRVEDFIAEHYVTINPLERYEPQNLGATN